MPEKRPPCTCELKDAQGCPISIWREGAFRPIKDCIRQKTGLPSVTPQPAVQESLLAQRIREVAEKKKAAQG
jgi:hypothetical protein